MLHNTQVLMTDQAATASYNRRYGQEDGDQIATTKLKPAGQIVAIGRAQ
jgi:hypothetical protein